MPERKLAGRLREAIRLRRCSIRTEKAYLHWYERYVRFHKLRHPATMGAPEVEAFLTHLAVHDQVSASTQNQALSALLFLYQEVLGIPLGDLHALHARRTTYVQPYLSHDECLRILAHLDGTPYLVACLPFGSGTGTSRGRSPLCGMGASGGPTAALSAPARGELQISGIMV